MNRNIGICIILAILPAATAYTVEAQTLRFSHHLSDKQTECLKELLRTSDWRYSPHFHKEMISIAQVATTALNNSGRTDYVYLFEADGWCGTAGCPLLIGEVQRGGSCRLLYNEAGDTSFTVLHRRDHGYRRTYAPCEARFDGHQHQQLHEECPNLDIHH